MPVRLQRKRTKGYRLPPDAVYVGRPTRWGNDYVVGTVVLSIGDDGITGVLVEDAAQAVEMFRNDGNFVDIAELRGKDLACWCPLEDADGNRVPCHADVLLEWANEGDGDD